MKQTRRQSGFTAVELLITLFVAAAFLIAAYSLFNLVIKDGGATRGESRAANVAYDYMRQYAASSTTIPCTPSTPLTDAPLSVDGLENVTVNITVTCFPDGISSLSKVTVTLSYNSPVQTVTYATYVSASGNTGTGDITNGLVAWWKLNGDGNTAIGSPNGVVTNATSTTNAAGQSDMAYSFNGSNSSIITNSSFGLGTTNVTISCWVYNPTATNSGAFVKVGSTGYGIGIGNTSFDNSSPGTKIIMLYEGVRWIVTGTNLGTGWHHVVMTINGSGVPTAYLDGVSTGSYAGTGPSAPGSQQTFIGGGNGTRFFNGAIDDVRLYNRALPLADILSLYSAGAR
jgi:prepilin-type N-terminal cleavage/methylation domain-containing protein